MHRPTCGVCIVNVFLYALHLSVSSTLDLSACLTAQCVLTHVPEFLFVLLCFSCCQTSFCRHHSGPITFFPTFCEPISLCPMCFKSQHSSIILSFSFSFMQPASSPSPRHPGRTHCCTSLHLLHLCHREYLHSRGPVLFPTTVGLCYLALSESNHQIFYYSHSSINHAQFLQIDLSLMKYQILVLTDSLYSAFIL